MCILLAISMTSCSTSVIGSLYQASKAKANNSNNTAESNQGGSIIDEIINIGHEHTFKEEVINPTCGTKGYTIHTCTECGYYYIDNIKDEIGSHEYENGVCKKCNQADYPTLINHISTEIIKANVTVIVRYYVRSFGMKSLIGESSGSGIIFGKFEGTSSSTYYVLSNNHVVYSAEMMSRATYIEYIITDHSGNSYKANVLANDSNYDLAVLKFSSNEDNYVVLELDTTNPEKETNCISLGQPEGQSNTITLGKVLDYGTVNLSETAASESNVKFDVIKHDAYINNGSSGGALIGYDFKIIGINYAGSKDPKTGNYISSYAIPIEKVIEFLKNNGIIEEQE